MIHMSYKRMHKLNVYVSTFFLPGVVFALTKLQGRIPYVLGHYIYKYLKSINQAINQSVFNE